MNKIITLLALFSISTIQYIESGTKYIDEIQNNSTKPVTIEVAWPPVEEHPDYPLAGRTYMKKLEPTPLPTIIATVAPKSTKSLDPNPFELRPLFGEPKISVKVDGERTKDIPWEKVLERSTIVIPLKGEPEIVVSYR